MADASDSKSDTGDSVWVQVPPSAPKNDLSFWMGCFLLFGDLNGRSSLTQNASESSVFLPGMIAIFDCGVSPTFGTKKRPILLDRLFLLFGDLNGRSSLTQNASESSVFLPGMIAIFDCGVSPTFGTKKRPILLDRLFLLYFTPFYCVLYPKCVPKKL